MSQKPLPARVSTEVVSIIVFAVGVFLAASLWTFHAADPSLFSRTLEPAQNACGRVGSWIAAWFLVGLGGGAFLFPLAFVFVAGVVHSRESFSRVMASLAGIMVSALAFTVFLSVQWKSFPYADTHLLTGGTLGAWVARALETKFNPLGASIVTLAVSALALVVATPVRFAQLIAQSVGSLSRVGLRGGCIALRASAVLVAIVTLRLLRGVWDGSHAAAKIMWKAWKTRTEKSSVLASGVVDVPQTTLASVEAEAELAGDATSDAEFTEYAAETEIAESNADDLLSLSDSDTETDEIDIQQMKSPRIEPPAPMEFAPKVANKKRITRGAWKLPTIEFLRTPPKRDNTINRSKLNENAQKLVKKLADFGISGEVLAIHPGPVITLYEFNPGPGIKVSRIAALADDLSMALSAQSVRILAPLPGKSVVGIEIPNEAREDVYLREFLEHPDFTTSKLKIPIAMGKNIGGHPVFADLARMPHLLCAGQTGSGKSIFMNGLICSLFYRFTPDEMKIILIDPKYIEFRVYQDVPHLMLPVVDDPKQASTTLKWAVREMDRRYRILAMVGARNLEAFNRKVDEMGADAVADILRSEDTAENRVARTVGADWIEAFEPDEAGCPRVGRLQTIVIIIDELADLMMVARKDVEISITRIAQKARAAGIHLVIATQRPSTDVVTGLIKANLPSRASFQLASYVDSKTIIDRAGAEKLLGMGDMLFVPPGTSTCMRVHSAFVDDHEITKIAAFWKEQGKPTYRDEILLMEDEEEGDELDDADELFDQAHELVKRSGHASASFLQRHLKIGYNRAARMIEQMEAKGIVGPADGARPREVLIR